MNANLAFAPIARLTADYDSAGVDFLFDRELAETGETIGAADFVEWVDFDGDADDFDEDAADAIIADQGYERTTPWNFDLEYATAEIAKVEA